MTRVRTRWRWQLRHATPSTVVFFITLNLFSVAATASNSDCWFNNQSHEEGAEVPTAEPCLNCTCRQGALVCYLRVCAQLPNPPPSGCIILHRYKKCCPELICTDFPEMNGNSLEARSEPEDLDLMEYSHVGLPEACIVNGTVYGPGSAMISSSYCEYCFCIKGRQKCVRPKCLLHLDGCKPIFEPHSCCPTRYNCTGLGGTTTHPPTEPFVRGGCIVSGTYYPEGSRVLGVEHTECDNCYCIKGVLRCEPMACSPPFPGCHPVTTVGECCASSYNCNGTIRINAQPNYGNHPTISKEYAKLRRESDYPKPFKLNTKKTDAFHVLAEAIKSTTKTVKHSGTVRHGATTRHFTGNVVNPGTGGPSYNTVSTRSLHSLSKPPTHMGTTNYAFQTTNYKRPSTTTQLDFATASSVGTTYAEERSDQYGLGEDVIMSLLDLLSDGGRNETEETTTMDQSTLNTETSTGQLDATTAVPTAMANNMSATTVNKSVITTTDCVTTFGTGSTLIDQGEDSTRITELMTGTDGTTDGTTVTEDTTLETMSTTQDVTVVDVKSNVKVVNTTVNSSPELNLIVNLSKGKDDDYGEYDYNHPTLPPSLPNLQIIPFVAADALDTKKDKDEYAIDRMATESSNYGLFSPPTKTEGGFQPPNSSILQKLYEKGYHSTIDLPFVTSPVPAITNPPKSPEDNCMYEGREVIHGESVTSEGVCIFCVCFYGNIVCPTSQCPPPGSGCHSETKPPPPSCCPKVPCDDYKIMDRVDFLPPEEFIQANITLTTTDAPDEDAFSLDRIFNLFIPDTSTHKQTIVNVTAPVPVKSPTKGMKKGVFRKNSTNVDIPRKDQKINGDDHTSPGVVGPLKLAGCNIYGRMYRVGRIISELSSPCRECRCTEIGVQCRSLTC